MRAGLLRHIITIVAQASGRDGLGQLVPGAGPAQEVLTTPASICAASSKDVYTRGGRTGQVTHKITIRWTSTPITSGMQILFPNPGGAARAFLIQDPPTDPDEMRRELDLMVLELGKEAVS